ncbi:MAG: hypothetical protein WCQ16_09910, partial [Verrucomicrobiae bacterium]
VRHQKQCIFSDTIGKENISWLKTVSREDADFSGEPGGTGCRSESKALGRLEKDLSAGHAQDRGEGFGRNLINTAAGSPQGVTRGSVIVNIRSCGVRRPAGLCAIRLLTSARREAEVQ